MRRAQNGSTRPTRPGARVDLGDQRRGSAARRDDLRYCFPRFSAVTTTSPMRPQDVDDGAFDPAEVAQAEDHHQDGHNSRRHQTASRRRRNIREQRPAEALRRTRHRVQVVEPPVALGDVGRGVDDGSCEEPSCSTNGRAWRKSRNTRVERSEEGAEPDRSGDRDGNEQWSERHGPAWTALVDEHDDRGRSSAQSRSTNAAMIEASGRKIRGKNTLVTTS